MSSLFVQRLDPLVHSIVGRRISSVRLVVRRSRPMHLQAWSGAARRDGRWKDCDDRRDRAAQTAHLGRRKEGRLRVSRLAAWPHVVVGAVVAVEDLLRQQPIVQVVVAFRRVPAREAAWYLGAGLIAPRRVLERDAGWGGAVVWVWFGVDAACEEVRTASAARAWRRSRCGRIGCVGRRGTICLLRAACTPHVRAQRGRGRCMAG